MTTHLHSRSPDDGLSFRASLRRSLLGGILALLLCSPQLIAYFISRGSSPRAFSDWDEPLYLQLLHSIGLNPTTFLSAPEAQNVELPLGFPYPHVVTDFVIGSLASLLHLSPLQTGLALDLFSVTFGFLVLSLLFEKLSGDARRSELVAALTLAIPWILPLTGHFGTVQTSHLILTPSSEYVCQPILRSAYTQLSLLLFPLIFVKLAKNRERDSLIGGAVTGGLIYVYLFAWITFSVVGALFSLLTAFSRASAKKKPRLRLPVLFSTTNLLVAAPGLSLLLLTHSPSTYLLDRSTTWYLPPEIVVLTVLFLRGSSLLSRFGGAVCLSELVLMNLQNLTRLLLEPHHFTTFYLHPLLSGVVLLSLLSRIRLSSSALTVALSVPIALLSFMRAHQTLSTVRSESELNLLLSVIQRETPRGANVVAIPFLDPFPGDSATLSDRRLLPYWIRAIAERGSFPSGEKCPPELFTGWLFSGTPQPVGACPSLRRSTEDPNLSTFAFHELRRYDSCQSFRTPPPPCALLAHCRVDFVVFESAIIPSPPKTLLPYLQERWRGREHSLWSFERDAAKAALCATPSEEYTPQNLPALSGEIHEPERETRGTLLTLPPHR